MPDQLDPAEGLAGTLASSVQHARSDSRPSYAGPPFHPCQDHAQVGVRQSRCEGAIARRNSLGERDRPAEIEDGAGKAGREDTVDDHSVVLEQGRRMDVEILSASASVAPGAGRVDASDRRTPHGKPVHHGRRSVADRGAIAEERSGRRYEAAVALFDRGVDGPSRVRATADSLELPRPNQLAYLGMVEPACAELTEQDDLVHPDIRSALARV